jgi:predicted MPP superfamily phosphohydrolase
MRAEMSFASRTVIVFVIMLLLEYYFIKKAGGTITAVFPGVRWKKFNTSRNVILILLNLYPLVLLGFYFSNSKLPDSRLIDYVFLYPFWVYIFIVIQSVLFFPLFLIAKGLIYPFYKKHKDAYLKIENKLILGLVVFFILYVPTRIIFDYYAVSVRNVVFTKQGLNPALNNFRLVMISDLHADRHTDSKRLGNYIDKVNNLKPDLVLIGGDMISGNSQYIDTTAEYVGKIKAKFGVYTCRGDHDYWAYRPDMQRSVGEITDALGRYKVPMLNNENLRLDIHGAKMLISFITYTYPDKINPDLLDELLAEKKEDLNILLLHQPEGGIPEKAAQNNYDLMLAGHTHGGQITFLFPFINLSPTLIETRFVRGNFHIGNMLLVVTRGLGMSLVPLRLNSTPEITVITIRKN